MLTITFALGTLLALVGAWAFLAGTRKRPERVKIRRRRFNKIPTKYRYLGIVGIALGIVAAVVTGWVVAIILVPALIVAIPYALEGSNAKHHIAQLEALEEWTRYLAGSLVAGKSLEDAIIASHKSTPVAIEPQVTKLVRRLRNRAGTERALRLFADDLDDPVGDVVAVNLILGCRRRGKGLSTVLHALASTVSHDVAARRKVEADRATPRDNVRLVTFITLVFLVVLFTGTEYMAPYSGPLGQVALVFWIGAYLALLLVLRRMSASPKPPRFIGLAQESRS